MFFLLWSWCGYHTLLIQTLLSIYFIFALQFINRKSFNDILFLLCHYVRMLFSCCRWSNFTPSPSLLARSLPPLSLSLSCSPCLFHLTPSLSFQWQRFSVKFPFYRKPNVASESIFILSCVYFTHLVLLLHAYDRQLSSLPHHSPSYQDTCAYIYEDLIICNIFIGICIFSHDHLVSASRLK